MKPVKGGTDRVVHINKPKTDAYTDKIGSTPRPFHNCDLSGDAINAIAGTSIRDLLPAPRTVSRNQGPRRAIPKQEQPRQGDGKFAARRQIDY